MTTKITGRQRDFVIWLDKQIYGLSKHWLAAFNTLVLVYVGLPFVAPVLMKSGLTGPANLIYTAYSPLCHQFAFRSWFLFGERPFYEAADFEAFTGIDPYDLMDRFAAKAFVGNETMGFKVAYCERDVAIYGAIFLAGLVFAAVRASGVKIRPLNFILYGLIGVAPIALDGFSQLFSQAPFNFLPLRESTPFFRTLTGFLFGAMNVWLAYPYVEESFAEIKVELETKLARAGEFKT
jgi:uncharacterized membrane protein